MARREGFELALFERAARNRLGGHRGIKKTPDPPIRSLNGG